MKRGLSAITICAVACAFAFSSAHAIGIGPRGGYYRNTGADEGDWLFGVALRAKLLPILGVEGSVDYRQDSYGIEGLTVRSWPVQVTGLVYPFSFLYGAVGAGWYNTSFDYDPNVYPFDDNTEQDFGWHLGGGLEIPLGTAAALTGDVRYVYLNTDFGGLPDAVQGDSNFYMMTVGLLIGTP